MTGGTSQWKGGPLRIDPLATVQVRVLLCSYMYILSQATSFAKWMVVDSTKGFGENSVLGQACLSSEVVTT